MLKSPDKKICFCSGVQEYIDDFDERPFVQEIYGTIKADTTKKNET